MNRKAIYLCNEGNILGIVRQWTSYENVILSKKSFVLSVLGVRQPGGAKPHRNHRWMADDVKTGERKN